MSDECVKYKDMERVEQAIKEMRSDISDIKDNHLSTIEAWILVLDRDVGRIRKALGIGIAVLAVVITLAQVL